MKKTWIPEFWWIEDKLISADGASDSRMGHAIVVRQYIGQHVMQELGLPALDWDDAPSVRCYLSDVSIADTLRSRIKPRWSDEQIDEDPWGALDAAARAAKLPGHAGRGKSDSLSQVWSDAVDATDYAVTQLGWIRIAGLMIDVTSLAGNGKWRLKAAAEALMQRYPAFYSPDRYVFVHQYRADQRNPLTQRSLLLGDLAQGKLTVGVNPPGFRPDAVRKLEKDITHPYYRNHD